MTTSLKLAIYSAVRLAQIRKHYWSSIYNWFGDVCIANWFVV